jgi:diaminopimelate decarboxylase
MRCVDLTGEFGTPLLSMRRKRYATSAARYMAAFREHYDDFEVIYASKRSRRWL